ncbi:MAG: hypothetical protein K1X81_03020 [Bacteroidia bacterium]|nr:hypothetical protein [Bacteroidia bacterium]
MKTDTYTKIVLTVIAICLTLNLFKEVDLFPRAFAGTNATHLTQTVAVPVNADGSINVKLAKQDLPIEVDIVKVNGNRIFTYGGECPYATNVVRPNKAGKTNYTINLQAS